MAWRLCGKLEQIEFAGLCNGLSTAIYIHFAVNVIDVGLDGTFSEDERFRYFPVGHTGYNQLKYLYFTLAERLGQV